MSPNTMRQLYPIALGHFANELSATYLPVIYPILIVTLGLTYAQVGFIALVVSAGETLSQPIFGYLSDRWGSGRIIVASVVWIGILLGLVGLTRSYWTLLLVVGLGALGSAAYHPAGASAAGSVTAKGRAGALSIFTVGGTLGAALSPLLIAAATGWWGLSGTLILIPITLLIALLLYPKLGRKSNFHVRELADESPQSLADETRAANGLPASLALIILMIMSLAWFTFSLLTYLPEWLQSQGCSAIRSGQMLTILQIAIGAGALMGGWLSDRIGRWQVLALSLGFLGPTQWLFLSASGILQIVLIGLIGVWIGAIFPVATASAQEAWPRRMGIASSLVTGLGWLPGGLGASATGFIADQTTLTTALHWLVAAPVLGLVCALLYARIHKTAGYIRRLVTEIEITRQ